LNGSQQCESNLSPVGPENVAISPRSIRTGSQHTKIQSHGRRAVKGGFI
jgi:hypothetical protein